MALSPCLIAQAMISDWINFVNVRVFSPFAAVEKNLAENSLNAIMILPNATGSDFALSWRQDV